jgi:hypothetical protein
MVPDMYQTINFSPYVINISNDMKLHNQHCSQSILKRNIKQSEILCPSVLTKSLKLHIAAFVVWTQQASLLEQVAMCNKRHLVVVMTSTGVA